ncbi:hypothetical protein DI272_10670 [Streptomyces sp. Act143]|uniref:hypothetical protein n=1 Tax=Streptomyces sp. Act143 TaxID=2200760 RepID=UPI000D678D3E|nr:hypothetical protein [Streptomyces sp. Act143]PWI14567.1 hypothetical protein DI272_10670 [Streptomyces sp. Act143]
MIVKSSGVWLGDVARAVAALGRSDPETVRTVMELLGVESSAGTAAVRPPAASDDGLLAHIVPPATEFRERDDDLEPPPPRPVPMPMAAPAPLPGEGPTLLTPVVRASRPPVAWTAPALAPASRTTRPPLREPLLAPRSASAIVQAAVSRREPDGEVDIPGAVGRLAQGLPLGTLPRRPSPTLRFGVQVLVDRGTGMQPFHRDQDELVARIRRTVGQETTEVLYFEDAPLHGTGTAEQWPWHPYAPPAPGTRVLLLTDLGLGGPPRARQSGRTDWERFFDRLAHSGCTPVVFLPYPRHRWPAWARDRVRMVPWDRRTTVGWVRMHQG